MKIAELMYIEMRNIESDKCYNVRKVQAHIWIRQNRKMVAFDRKIHGGLDSQSIAFATSRCYTTLLLPTPTHRLLLQR